MSAASGQDGMSDYFCVGGRSDLPSGDFVPVVGENYRGGGPLVLPRHQQHQLRSVLLLQVLQRGLSDKHDLRGIVQPHLSGFVVLTVL